MHERAAGAGGKVRRESKRQDCSCRGLALFVSKRWPYVGGTCVIFACSSCFLLYDKDPPPWVSMFYTHTFRIQRTYSSLCKCNEYTQACISCMHININIYLVVGSIYSGTINT